MAKHPVPKKKTSRARTSRRYKSFQNRARKKLVNRIQLVKCESCAAPKRAHHVCADCGSYKGKDVLSRPEAKAAPEVKKEDVTKIKAD